MFVKLQNYVEHIWSETYSPQVVAIYRLAFAIFAFEYSEARLFYYTTPEHVFLAVLLKIACVCLLFGVRPRASALLCGALVVYFTLTWGWRDGDVTFHRHHPFLIGFTLLILAFAENLPVFYLFRLLALVIYISSAAAKISPQFLSGICLEQVYMYLHSSSLDPSLFGSVRQTIFQILSWGAMCTEFAIPVLLLVPRWRKTGIWVAVSFHTVLWLLMPVGSFSANMVFLLLAFLTPQEWQRLLQLLMRMTRIQGESSC